MITRFYYTFSEIFANNSSAWEAGKKPFYASLNTKKFKDLIDVVAGSSFFIETVYTSTLFQEYLWPVINNQNICYLDIEHDRWTEPVKPEIWSSYPNDEPAKDMRNEVVGRIYAWLIESKFKYEKLIALYTAQEANLLKAIETTSLSKFNDTPQSQNAGYDDTHTTNASKTVNTNEAGTTLQRLEEVRKKYNSIYQEWAAEFQKIFILGE